MDLRKLKTLVDLVSESNISELEITEADGKVRIVKSERAPSAALTYAPAVAGAPVIPAAPIPAMAAAVAVPVAEAAAPAALTGHVVRSPMVGTFYRASSPGAKPLVDVGAAVKEGDPICIIEAMKIMNEIESEFAGTVVEIRAEDSHPVEYGQVLFRIDPNG